MKFQPLVLLVTCLLAACGGGPKPDAVGPAPTVDKGGGPVPKPPTPPLPVTPLGEVKLSARVEPTPLPNQYQVIVQWSFVGENPEGWVLDRTEDPGGAFKSLGRLDAIQRQFLDTTSAPGKSYRFTLDSLKDAARTKLAQVDVVIPRDLEIRDTQEYETIAGVARLFLRKGSILRPRGAGLFIDVGTIVSDDAVIESFAANSSAGPGVRGRAGAPLVVKANVATGSLRIFPRGEAGGRGVDGAPGEKGMNSFNQANGDLVPARSGGQGGPGNPGQPGMDGGDASLVYIDIANPSGLDLPQPFAQPGKGGMPGKGGPGGPGGAGGFNLSEPPSPNGPPGVAGMDSTIVGKDGNPLPICLKLGSATIGDCARFPVPPTLAR